MESSKVWKGSLLAVVAILAVTVFVGKMDEWTHSVTDAFVVYGQSSGGGGGGGGGTTLSTIRVIPTIVAGTLDGNFSRYSTTIQIANTSSSSVDFQATFYESGVLTTLQMASTHTGASIFTGTTPSLTLAAQQVVAITITSTASLRSLWGQIASTAALTITPIFDQRAVVSGNLLGRIGVTTSDSNMQQFAIPRIRDAAHGLETGFAIVNTTTSTITLTGTLRNAAGTVIATKSRNVTARETFSQFIPEFFSNTTLVDQTGVEHQMVTFDCGTTACGALGLGLEGTTLSSLPVTKLQ